MSPEMALEECRRELAAVRAEAATREAALREALLGFVEFELDDGPCWCTSRSGYHDKECKAARAALSASEGEPPVP